MKGLIIDLSNEEPKFHVIDEGAPLRVGDILGALNQVQGNLLRMLTQPPEENQPPEEEKKDEES